MVTLTEERVADNALSLRIRSEALVTHRLSNARRCACHQRCCFQMLQCLSMARGLKPKGFRMPGMAFQWKSVHIKNDKNVQRLQTLQHVQRVPTASVCIQYVPMSACHFASQYWGGTESGLKGKLEAKKKVMRRKIRPKDKNKDKAEHALGGGGWMHKLGYAAQRSPRQSPGCAKPTQEESWNAKKQVIVFDLAAPRTGWEAALKLPRQTTEQRQM